MSILSGLMANPTATEKLKEIAEALPQGGNVAETEDGEFSEKRGELFRKAENNKNINLLNAILPFMSKRRASKVGIAIKAIRTLSVLSSLKG